MTELGATRESGRTQDRRRLASDTLTVTGIVLAMVIGVVVLYATASAFLLIFASLLFAAILCGIGRLFQTLGLPRWAAMLLVYLLLLTVIAAPIAWGGATVFQQFGELSKGVVAQGQRVFELLGQLGLPIGGGEAGASASPSDLTSVLPNASGLMSTASKAVLSFLGGFGNFFVVVFLAAFISWQPGLYRDGLVSLFPKHKRARIDETLRKSAHSLIMWVAGDAISMTMIFCISWIGLAAIGVDSAFLLALQAGLLAFIPTLGAFVAGVVIVLAALAQGPDMALWALGVYILIQGVESNVAQPIAQRFTSALPPALTLGFQIVCGLLFGLLGFVLAVPILAVVVTIVEELYIEDVLGGGYEGQAAPSKV